MSVGFGRDDSRQTIEIRPGDYPSILARDCGTVSRIVCVIAAVSPFIGRFWEASQMHLGTAEGDTLDLRVTGYQFPDAVNPKQRYSWHMVAGWRPVLRAPGNSSGRR